MSEPQVPARLGDLDFPTWRRAEAILDQALDLPAPEQAAFLDRACGGDSALRAFVESLLEADRDAGGVLDRPLGSDHMIDLLAQEPPAPEPPPERLGMRLGPWRLLRGIGRGGMGTVYEAERVDGTYEQRVAIKLVRQALESADVHQRFLRERRILARLEHPNIARLLDGGVTDDGTPFIAMERVDGVPITAWCEQSGAPLPRVLRLFVQVCRAVDYAHRNLVVHRDLKPANILVTTEGDVKLLDFGIAKLLAPGAEDTDATLTVERRLTPHYAAPEQIRGEAATTTTDVYALGVVLYELLTGLKPFHDRTAPAELDRAVLEQDPPPPSVALAAAGAGARQKAWGTRVRGDLDRIVMQAMRKDRAGRYPSAQALLEDVERWLEGRPVRATPPTLGYRARRFVSRYPIASAAAGALLLSLVAGLIGVSSQAARAREERQKAEAIRDFALGLFRASDPSEAKGDTLTARALLERGVSRVDHELQGRPALQAEMYSVLGGVFRELEVPERAQRMYERAVALQRQAHGARSPQAAPDLVKLAAVLTDQAKHAEAEQALREAMAVLGPRGHDRDRARALAGLALVRGQTGHFAEAESLYLRSLAIGETAFGRRSVPVAQILDDLGDLYFDRRDFLKSADCFERALALRLELLGRDDVSTATSMENVASAVGPLGRHAREDSLHREALAIYRRLLGPESIKTGNVLSNLGAVYYARGERDSAESAMTEAARVFRRRLGDDHPETARALNNLAYLNAAYNRLAPAESLYRLAVDSWRRTLGERHPLTLHGENNLAAVLRDQGRFGESERLFRGVLGASVPDESSDDAELAMACHHLGILCMRTRRYDEAERLLRRALTIRRRNAGGWSGPVSQSLSALGEVLLYENRIPESRSAFEEVGALAMARHETDPGRVGSVGLGRALTAAGELARAESLLTDGVAARESLWGATDRRTFEARASLGICYAAQGRRDLAEPILVAAIPVLAGSPACPQGLVQQSREALAHLKRPAALPERHRRTPASHGPIRHRASRSLR